MAKVGVVAGSGKLPIIFADLARAKGEKLVGIGLKGVTDPALESHVDKFIWVDPGAVQKAVFAIVTERIFNWPGLGRMLYQAIGLFDTPVIVGDTIIYAYLLAITVFLLDFIYALVDPRVKIGGGSQS